MGGTEPTKPNYCNSGNSCAYCESRIAMSLAHVKVILSTIALVIRDVQALFQVTV